MPARAARTFLVLIALAATVAVIPIGNAVNAAQMSREDYEACQTNDEPKFRKAVETIIAKALTGSVATVEYTALVSDHWRDGNVDQIIDDRVDLAVSEVRDETSWGNLIKSLGSKDTAQELATAVAERVYRSEAMKAALETLAAGVAHDIGRRLELATSDAASPALSCLELILDHDTAMRSQVSSPPAMRRV